MSAEQNASYGWKSSEMPHNAAYITPKILEILAGLGVKRVVDLGSGNGTLCNDLQQAGYDVVGVEYDKEGVEISKKQCPGIPFYNLDLAEDPSELLNREGPFDVAVSTEVIEHLYSPHKLIEFAKAVVKPGGHLVVSTPYHGYLKNMALSVANRWDGHFTALWHGGHVKFWSRDSLSELLRGNGFEVAEFYGVGRVKYLWKSMILVATDSTKD